MNIVSAYNVWKEEFGDRYNQEELRKYTKGFLKKWYSEIKEWLISQPLQCVFYSKVIGCDSDLHSEYETVSSFV